MCDISLFPPQHNYQIVNQVLRRAPPINRLVILPDVSLPVSLMLWWSRSQNAFLFPFSLSFLIPLVKMLCSLLVLMVWYPRPDRLCLCRVCVRAQAGLSSFLCSGTARRLVVRSEIMSRSCGVTRLQSLERTFACARGRCHSCTCINSAAHH